MDMGNLISRVEEAGSELRARALRCESVDKLVELAEENSIELTKEEAEQLFRERICSQLSALRWACPPI